MDRIGKTVNMMKSLGPDHAQGSMKVTGEIHHSSGFEFTSISSTPDNMSKTSPSHSEDSVDEKEEKHTNGKRRKGFFKRRWMAILLCCISLPDSVESLSPN